MTSQSEYDRIAATIASGSSPTGSHLDVFRLGWMSLTKGGWEVIIGIDQSPGKVKPFASANCWVHQPWGQPELNGGEVRACYRL